MKCNRQKPRKQLTTEKRYKWIIIFISKGNTLFRQRKYVGEYQLSGRSNWIQNKLTTLVTSVKLENLFPTKEVINRERLSVFFSGPSHFCSSYSHESFEDGGALGTTLPLHAFMEDPDGDLHNSSWPPDAVHRQGRCKTCTAAACVTWRHTALVTCFILVFRPGWP